jgi:hypothetical protein
VLNACLNADSLEAVTPRVAWRNAHEKQINAIQLLLLG